MRGNSVRLAFIPIIGRIDIVSHAVTPDSDTDRHILFGSQDKVYC